jgi:predicted PurR-regulated permease PerM
MVQLVATLAVLRLGREVFIPVAIAFLLATVLRPVVRRMEARRVPAPLGAGVIVVCGLVLLWVIGYALTPPVQNFARQLPQVAQTASAKLKALPRPLDRLGTMLSTGTAAVKGASAESDTTASHQDSTAASNASRPAEPSSASSVAVRVFPILSSIFGTAAGIASAALEILLLLLFFLAAGDHFRRRLVTHGARSKLARALVDVGDEMQSIISRYLSLLALINLVQGTFIAVAMAIIGMPVPPVWGAMAFVAEFFPYLGSATMVILLTLVGLADSSGPHVLLAPAIYLGMTTLQNSVVSPVTYGRSLRLNPAAILVSVMVWWALWGVIGAFLAVPILATIRVVCERQGGSLHALGALIEG